MKLSIRSEENNDKQHSMWFTLNLHKDTLIQASVEETVSEFSSDAIIMCGMFQLTTVR